MAKNSHMTKELSSEKKSYGSVESLTEQYCKVEVHVSRKPRHGKWSACILYLIMSVQSNDSFSGKLDLSRKT